RAGRRDYALRAHVDPDDRKAVGAGASGERGGGEQRESGEQCYAAHGGLRSERVHCPDTSLLVPEVPLPEVPQPFIVASVTRPGIGMGVVAQAALRARDAHSSRLGRDWAPVLAEVPLFAQLPKRQLGRVAGLARVRRFAPGAAIIRAGERGDAFY